MEIAYDDKDMATKEAIDHSDVSGRQQDDGKTIDNPSNSMNETGKNSTSTTGNNNGNASGTTSGKRAKNKKRREAQQEFAHSWMAGALKGHTGPVLDMNFSSNGKFLASCAEDCDLVREEEPELRDDASSCEGEYVLSSTNPTSTGSSNSSSSPSPTSTNNSSPSRSRSTGKSSKVQVEGTSSSKDRSEWSSLSRRQRKNRTRTPREQQRRDRDDDNDDENDHQSPSQSPSPSRHRHHHRLLQHHNDLNSRHFHQESPTRDGPSSVSNSPQRSATSHRSSAQYTLLHQGGNIILCLDPTNVVSYDSEVKTGLQSVNNGYQEWMFRSDISSPTMAEIAYAHYYYDQNIREQLCHLTDGDLSGLLQRYILGEAQMEVLGYPFMHHLFHGFAMVSNFPYPTNHRPRGHHQHRLNANAREFVPRNRNSVTSWFAVELEADSGNGSGSSVENSDLEPECSSDSEKNSDSGEFYSSSSSTSSYAEKLRRDPRSFPGAWDNSETSSDYFVIERSCARCHKSFFVNREDGEYICEEMCVYHWGKLRYGEDRRQHQTWQCCQGHEDSQGCTLASSHVWTGLIPGINGPIEGYMSTRPCVVTPQDGYYGIYALDCEMCFTRRGLVLAKVTVVGMDGHVIYDTLVKPDDEVIDYNTRFSGITEEDLATATKTLREVQYDLIRFIHAETILIGHGLENDLRALKLVHSAVIDTSVLFRQNCDLPYRHSLKTLARMILKRDIQVGEHDSVEDATIAGDLVLRYLQYDLY